MATRMYEFLLSIGGRVNSTLPSSTSSVSRSLQNVQRSAQSANRGFLGMSEGAGKAVRAVAGMAAAYMGFSAMKNFAAESVAGAKAQIDAETKLEAVLKNVKSIQAQGPEAYKKSKAELLGVASNLQKVGVIGDEVSLSGMQQLATFQLNSKQIGTLSGGMGDLLAQQKGLNATQGDAVNIANMIGKAMGGQVGALSRVGISFTKAQAQAIKTGDATQRAAVIAQVLKDNVGGVNKALAATDQGKIQQMNNAWGDMKELVGMKILPLQAKFAGWFTKVMPLIEKFGTGFFNKLTPAFNYVANTVIPGVSGAITKLQPTFQKVSTFIATEVTPRFKNIGYIVRDIAEKYFPNLSGSGDGLLTTLEGLVINGLNIVISALKFVRDNSDLVKTAVEIAGGAWLVYKGYVIAAAIWTGTMAIKANAVALATKAWTAAQWLWNVAMGNNPIGLVIIGIGLLIGAGILLYKNWDIVSAKASEVGRTIGNAFKSGVNIAIDAINWLTDKLNVALGLIGVKIPNITHIALRALPSNTTGIGSNQRVGGSAAGTDNWRGGWSWVGEKGPELLNIQKGAQIISNNKLLTHPASPLSGMASQLAIDGSLQSNSPFSKFTKDAEGIRDNSNAPQPNVTFAPVVTVSAGDGADKEKIDEIVRRALKDAQEKFEQWMEKYQQGKKRVAYDS